MAVADPRLDLSRPRRPGELVAATIGLFLRHSGLFLSVTLLVVAPYVLLVDGVWGRMLRDGHNAHPGTAASAASLLLSTLVIPPLVTGLHAVIVREMGKGFVPAVGEALRDVAPRLPAAFGAVALYTVGIAIGFVLLIVPGVWLSVRWYFGAQAAVLEGAVPGDALTRSAALVDGAWWRTFGYLLMSWIVFGIAGALAGLLTRLIHQPVAYVVVHVVLEAVALSLTALFGTLLFFMLRAKQAAPEAAVPVA